MNGSRRVVYPLVAGSVLGVLGLAVGYFAPIAFDSEATAGPLTGMFVTGPLCAVVGLIAGAIAAARRVSDRGFLGIVACLAIVSVVISLALSLPEDRFEGEIVEGEIVRCTPPASLVPAATSRWATMPPLRSGWREDVQRMLDDDRGVVITLHVTRTKSLYRSRKPWSSGKIVTNGWRAANRTEDYFAAFAGANCDAYHHDARGTYSLDWIDSHVSPPDVLSSFLGLWVLRPLAENSR